MKQKLHWILIAGIFYWPCYNNGLQAQSPQKEVTKVFDLHVHLNDAELSYQKYFSQVDTIVAVQLAAIVMAPRGSISGTISQNNAVIALSKKHSNVLPVCSVHPYDGRKAIKELHRLAGLGIKLIKLHPHSQNFSVEDKRVTRLCKTAGGLGITLLFDNANIKAGDNELLFNLAVKCPGTNFIFAHMGGLQFRFWNILPLVKTAEGFYKNNIYFDISAILMLIPGSPLEEEFTWTIRNIGIERFFLGSDFPQFRLQDVLKALDQLKLTDQEKEKIRYANAARFFK